MRRHAVILASAMSAVAAAAALAPAAPAGPPKPAADAATVQALAIARAAAGTEASRLVGALPVPPGSAGAPGEPAQAGGALAPAPGSAAVADVAAVTGWWTVPGGPRAAIEYTGEHLPERSAFSRSVFPVAVRAGVVQARVRLDEGAAPLAERWLVLTAVSLPEGGTVLRADAQVLWVRPHDAIPTRARVARVTIVRASGSRSGFSTRVRARVKAAARLIDSMAPRRPSLLPLRCPVERGSVTVAFFTSRHARLPLAVATAAIGGCGQLQLTIRGKPPQPELQQPAAGVLGTLVRTLGRAR